MRSESRWSGAALVLALIPALCAPSVARAAKTPRPRAVSEAERAAVTLALEYQQQGPAAWWDRLAPLSPLRELGRTAALAEIGARAGPAAGAVWTLRVTAPGAPPGLVAFTVEFPSGIDDTIQLELVQGAEAWQIYGLRSLADPVGERRRPALESAARFGAQDRPGRGVLAILAAVLAWGGYRFGRRSPGRPAPAGTLLALVVVAVAACSVGDREPVPGAEPGPLRLGELEPLRRVLAAGSDPVAIARELERKPSTPRLIEIRNLWHAQLLMAAGDPGAAERAVGRLAGGGDLPLAVLVRARLALLRLRTLDADSAYRELLELGPDHDGIRIESVEAGSLAEETRQSEIDNQLIVEMGSRVADPWYRAAYDAFRLERFDEAEALLGVGWDLRPVPRDELFGDPALAALAARPKIFPLLALGSPREPEPVVAVSSNAVTLPPGFEATLCGRELRLARGDSEILVPGGAGLSPAGTRPESAAARRDRHRERALAERATIRAALGAGADRLGPRLVRLADTAARALAEAARWAELVELTDGLGDRAGEAPQLLVRLRAFALDRLGRRTEAVELLIGLAERELGGRRRPAPGVLFDLAEALARNGDHDRAIKLVRRADADLPTPRGEAMLRQFEMSRDLERDALSHDSGHFDLRFPRVTGDDYAGKLAEVFERERARLKKWIPRAGEGRVTVELFPFERFLNSYGGAVAGVTLLDGRVRLPFADLHSLNPVLVEVLSHELAHAMLSAASSDRAPHWFHEGLAQHVQMGTGPVNPIPDLESEGRVLAFPVLEPVIASFTEPQLVEIAYAESAWAVGFLESRWGISALHRMESAFAEDRTTERAIREVCGMDLVEFDAAFRKWALRDAPRARSVAVTRYDLELDSPLERARPKQNLPRWTASAPPPAPELPAVGRAEMASWYRTYAARSAPVKEALRPVLGPLRSEQGLPDVQACRQLANESVRLLADTEALAAPDAAAADALRELYRNFAAVGEACSDGEETRARESFGRVEPLLGRAAGALAPYGQKP